MTDRGALEYSYHSIPLERALEAWKGTLEPVFRTRSGAEKEASAIGFIAGEDREKQAENCLDEQGCYHAPHVYVCGHKTAVPRVFIPVFPGTNCEYDSTRAFERAGAQVDVKVFRNLTAQDIRASVETFQKSIDQAQIIMFPGGFSAGDEPGRFRQVLCHSLPEREDEGGGDPTPGGAGRTGSGNLQRLPGPSSNWDWFQTDALPGSRKILPP